MAFVNSYTPKPEIPESELYGPEPYDLNFVLPFPPALVTDKLRLVPFIPRVHAASYFDGIRGHESMLKHMPGAMEHPADFLRIIETWRRAEGALILAAIDTTRLEPTHPERQGSFAGLFGVLNTSTPNLVTEIGPAIVLPAFQRTHVASHAVGLLLRHFLETPPVGVGFRKVRWAASPNNIPSNNLAERMGFKLEGVLRWTYVLPAVEGYPKAGNVKEADSALGRDTHEWGLCWDD